MSLSRLLELAADLDAVLGGAARGLDGVLRMLDVGRSIAADPMHQFEVQRWAPINIGGVDLSFTNSAFYMFVTVAVILVFLTLAMSRRALVPGKAQSMAELVYGFVNGMVRDNLGEAGMKFFPLVFSLFIFIFVANLLGLIPGTFTTTSQLIVTLAMSMLVISIVIVVGLAKHGLGFLKLFAPSGLPWWMYPLLVPIEIISFLSRPFSLAIRLFANMLAGHILLKLFAGFVIGLAGAGGAFIAAAILPLVTNTAVTALEFLVAFLQAYVFAILTCIYLNDALHPGH